MPHSEGGGGGTTNVVDSSGNIKSYNIAFGTCSLNDEGSHSSGRSGSITFNTSVMCAVACLDHTSDKGNVACYCTCSGKTVYVESDKEGGSYKGGTAYVIAIVEHE